MDLLATWEHWEPDAPPYIRKEDAEVLNSPRSMRAIIMRRGWQEAIQAPEFLRSGRQEDASRTSATAPFSVMSAALQFTYSC